MVGTEKEDELEDFFSSLKERKPRFRLHFDDLTHAASSSFLSLINCTSILPNSTRHVLRHLYRPCPESRTPEIRSVTLVLRVMEGVAYTTGIPLDELHKEIHINLRYIASFQQPGRCRDEIIGVCTHEMVHCWQNNCQGTAPTGLIEGIADFVRLRAGLAPPHWNGAKDEIGDSWDSGYQKTAYFLDWLEHTFGPGSIAKMNHNMSHGRYMEKEFWTGLFGTENDVDTLWNRYRASFEEDTDNSSMESNSSELVLVEVNESNAVGN